MARRLLVVEQRYLIRGKGLMLVPGFVPVEDDRVKAGHQVLLHRPDGSAVEATIQGTSVAIESGSPDRVFLLLEVMDKNQVPIGSEVWSIGT